MKFCRANIFYVEVGHCLDFIISKNGIRIDPLKVDAIISFPLTRTISKIQSLQGKANLLRHFIANYVDLTKGFMRLLKKDVHFVWDNQA